LAVHEAIIDGHAISPAVIEIEGDTVVSCYPLTGELPHTEWLGGTAHICNGKLRLSDNRKI